MQIRMFLALALASALSTRASASIIIGNPDDLATAFDGHDLEVDSADITSAELVALDCASNELASYGPMTFDLTSSPKVELPPGTCELRLAHAGTLVVDGDDGGTGTFTLELAVSDFTFVFAAPVPQTTDQFVIALTAPTWTDATELGLSSGTHVDVDANDAVHDTVVGRIESDAAVFIDDDGDGFIDATERAAGPVAD